MEELVVGWKLKPKETTAEKHKPLKPSTLNLVLKFPFHCKVSEGGKRNNGELEG